MSLGKPTLVVVVAFACEPGNGSEPGVGFAFARAAAELSAIRSRLKVIIVTRESSAASVRTALQALDADFEVSSVVAIPGRTSGVGWSSTLWQRGAAIAWQWRAALYIRDRLLPEYNSCRVVVHHVTYASDLLPTFESRIGAGRWIIGPVGGYSTTSGPFGALKSRLREIAARATIGGADLAVAQSPDVLKRWGASVAGTVEPNALVPDQLVDSIRSAMPSRRQFTFVVVGQLVARKRVDVALKAFARAVAEMSVDDRRDARLLIIGDGPLRRSLANLAIALQVGDQVEFRGAVSREDVLSEIAGSQALLHLSSHEGASGVVAEAQSVGTPPIVVAGCGSDFLVAEGGVGFIVDQADVEEISDALRKASSSSFKPSDRWRASRLCTLLPEWYRLE